MKNFNLENMGVISLNEQELVDIEGGKKFWDTLVGRVLEAVITAVVVGLVMDAID
jgi:hypothetical protein